MHKKMKRMSLRTLAAGGAVAAMAAFGTTAANASTWDSLAECESGGDWSINTGNGFQGGLQFHPDTWASHGGSGSAANASKAEQIEVAENVLDSQGWGAWPACSSKLGLSGNDAPSGGAPAPEPAPEPVETYEEPAADPVESPEVPAQQAPAEPQETYEAPAPAPAPVEYYEAPAPAPVDGSGIEHVVVSGDTMGSIADQYEVESWEDLFNLNRDTVEDPNVIFEGQVLEVPAD